MAKESKNKYAIICIFKTLFIWTHILPKLSFLFWKSVVIYLFFGCRFQSDLELSTMDSSELGGMEKNVDSDREDMEEETMDKVRSNSELESPMDMLSDLNDKTLVPSNVSITPITNTASPSYLQGRRL